MGTTMTLLSATLLAATTAAAADRSAASDDIAIGSQSLGTVSSGTVSSGTVSLVTVSEPLGAQPTPTGCPCWHRSQLAAVKKFNHLAERSCSSHVLRPPAGAVIQRVPQKGPRPTFEGGFAVIKNPLLGRNQCRTNDLPPYRILDITEAQANYCMQTIANRCKRIGDPFPEPTEVAPRADPPAVLPAEPPSPVPAELADNAGAARQR